MPDEGNALGVKTPFGSLTASGRDVMLVAIVAVLGAGIIGTQLYTFNRFEKVTVWGNESLKTRADLIYTEIRTLAHSAQDERAQMLELMRLRLCADTFFTEASRIQDQAVREAMAANWKDLCLRMIKRGAIP